MTETETMSAPRPDEEPPGAGRPRFRPGATTQPEGPADPGDYALLNGVYFAGLSALALISLRRERRGDERSIPLRELPLLAAATFALAHLLAKEKVTTWLREPFVEEGADHKPVRPEGSGLRYAVGELLTCPRCVGSWCALGLVGLRTASPAAGRTVNTVLASAGANNVFQSCFRLLTETTNKAEREAQAAAP